MSSFQYFVAASLDGFIATADDDLAWLLQFDGFDGGKESYDTFMAGVGCIVMGGETYAWLMKHEPGNWPYPSTPCYVFTHHEYAAPPGSDITFVRGPVREFIAGLQGRRRRRRTSGWWAAATSPRSSPPPGTWMN